MRSGLVVETRMAFHWDKGTSGKFHWSWIVDLGRSLGRSGRRIVSDVRGSLGRSGCRIVSDAGGSLGRSGRGIVSDVGAAMACLGAGAG
jgi:hypothetical protein